MKSFKTKKMVPVFEPIEFEVPDSTILIDELDIEGLAKRNGQKGLPFESDTESDSAELAIKSAIDNKIGQACLSAQRSYDEISTAIEAISLDGEISALKELADSFNKRLNIKLASFKDDFLNANVDVEKYEEDYDRFRKVNSLKREASYPESLAFFWSFLFFILVVESLLNAHFFALGSDFGYLGGVVQALMVSIVNVVIGGICGWLALRQLNHVKPWRKYVGGFAGSLFLIISFFWNLLVGHYRSGLAIDPDNAEQLAVQRFLESPLGLNDLASWMLFMIGTVVFILVNYKTYSADDPYPGYKKVDRRLNNARKDLTSLKAEWDEEVEAEHERELEDLDDLFKICKERADRIERSYKAINYQVSILNKYVNGYRHVYKSCIKTYRQVNKQSRDEPYPAYFDTEIVDDFSHEFSTDTLTDKKELIRTQRDEINKLVPEMKTQLLSIRQEMLGELE